MDYAATLRWKMKDLELVRTAAVESGESFAAYVRGAAVARARQELARAVEVERARRRAGEEHDV